MQILRQSTEIDVRLGPFVDSTDGVTPETGITLGAADQAEALKADGAATASIASNTWAAVTGADGWYDLTLTTTDTNTVGTLDIVIQDSSVCLPVFARFQVVEEAVYDALFASSADLAMTLAAGAITNASLAGNMEVVFETDFATNYNTTRNAWATNVQDTVGTGTLGLNDLSAAQVNTQVDTALADIHLDHLLAADYDPASKPGTATALLNELIESDGGVSRFTTNALEQAPTGGGSTGIITSGTAAGIADGTITLASGHGVTDTTVLVVLTGGTNADGKSRVATYSGTGDVFNVDPAWNATVNGNAETTPSGTITYEVWPIAPSPATYPVNANAVQISGDSTAADNLESAFDGTGYDVGGVDVSELNQVVDDLINGGRLDLLIDAIKAKTDSLNFTQSGNVDANVQYINDNAVIGDGDATPWDGA